MQPEPVTVGQSCDTFGRRGNRTENGTMDKYDGVSRKNGKNKVRDERNANVEKKKKKRLQTDDDNSTNRVFQSIRDRRYFENFLSLIS